MKMIDDLSKLAYQCVPDSFGKFMPGCILVVVISLGNSYLVGCCIWSSSMKDSVSDNLKSFVG